MKFGNVIKLLIGTFVTILLGAIGSGVWERVLSPGLKDLGNLVTSTISSISQTYSDSIYSRASSIADYDQSVAIGYILLLFISCWLLLYGLKSKKDHPAAGFIYHHLTRSFQGWFGIIYSGAIVIFILLWMATHTTVLKIQDYSMRTMDIVHPFVGEHKYLKLRSEYLSMKTEKDFKLFLEHLYVASNTANIEIDKF